MALVKMRDKQTGEFRDVEGDGPEHQALKAQVTPAGFPRWEQTSYAHANEVQDHATYAELLEHELGEDYKDALKHEALILNAEGVGPEHNPHLALSPGEIEAGLTPETKLEQLRKQYADSVPTREDILAKAHERISPSGEVTPRRTSGGKSRGLRARAGGSDDRANAPQVDASTQDEQSEGDDDAPAEPSQAERAVAAAQGDESAAADGEE